MVMSILESECLFAALQNLDSDFYVDILGITPKDFEQRSKKGPTCY
jgi:hypothetical protein